MSEGGANDESLADMLKGLMLDDRLSDVMLRGCDGVQVPANRCILAARSPAFRSLLCSDEVSEASSSVIEVGFEGWVLKAVVEFVYTDKVPCLFEDRLLPPREKAKKICALAVASACLGLEGLTKHIEEGSKRALAIDTQLALVLIDENRELGPSSRLSELAIGVIRSNPQPVLSASVLPSLDAVTLKAILMDSQKYWDEADRFRLIQLWAAGGDNALSKETKALVGKSLVNEVCLVLIEPRELKTTVAASGLVKQDDLFRAYQAQALKLNLYSKVHHELHCTKYDLKASIDKDKAAGMCVRPCIDAETRGILIDWLLNIQINCDFRNSTLFVAVATVDRFLEHDKIRQEKLQLLGVTAMVIASNFESGSAEPLQAEAAAKMCGGAYTKRDVSSVSCPLLSLSLSLLRYLTI